jgi:DNA-directed RNA polymerase I and III subunit RPAC2
MKNPAVDLCGYTVPHPMEKIIKIRVQTNSKEIGSTQALRDGCLELMKGSQKFVKKFDKALAKFPAQIVPKQDLEQMVLDRADAISRQKAMMD